MKKILSLFLAFCMALGFVSCKGKTQANLSPDGGIADQKQLYGICYEALNVRMEDADYDPEKDALLLKNLGVTSMRLWMQITDLLSSPTEIKEDKCRIMHTIIKAIQAQGITIFGVSHTNFNPGTATSGKPARDISEGSYYVKWLEDYYTSFKTLVSEFPEIGMWEMDNEVNNTDFMKNTLGESVYDSDDMAGIATDIFWYASKGIHEGNPSAKTVMGGLVGFLDGKIKTFMEKLYANISSGEYGYFYGKQDRLEASRDPDDYFEIACWHPYIKGAFSKKVFKSYNDEIYRVILENEGKHKKVFFSEIGFTNTTYKEAVAAKYVTSLFEVVSEEMPYVESIAYYKMFDYADATKYWTHEISRYGLFYDPIAERKYTDNETDAIVEAGAPKPAAYAFQAAAGGQGELNLNKIN